MFSKIDGLIEEMLFSLLAISSEGTNSIGEISKS